MADTPRIPIICGPTGSGKTGLSIALAESRDIEVVSADSRQVYKYLDIGTAKPTPEERARVPVHGIDLIEPGEQYSAYQFVSDATDALCSIVEQAKLPLVVGGTGLYLNALTEGIIKHEPIDPGVRKRLEAEMAQLGPEAMHKRLQRVDPAEAAAVHARNRVRIIRALEIYEQTGRSKTELLDSAEYHRAPFCFDLYRLLPERKELYGRTDKRVNAMMDRGLLEEIEALVDDGWAEAIRRSRVIGYTELLDYLEDRRSLQDAVDAIKQNTRRFAKRQVTWFRHKLDGPIFVDSAGLLRHLETKMAKIK